MMCFNQKFNTEFNKLMKKYPYNYLFEIKSSSVQITNFYDYAIPSMLSILFRENFGKWKCKFDVCLNLDGFSSKRSLLVHLMCQHRSELPGMGIFLLPTTTIKLNTCEYCEATFCKREQLDFHQITSNHFSPPVVKGKVLNQCAL
jgi:hypothetical protein